MSFHNIYYCFALHTYSTGKMPCFPICCTQHVNNVTMDSDNQPWSVLFNPVWQEGNGHKQLAVELKMENYKVFKIGSSNTVYINTRSHYANSQVQQEIHFQTILIQKWYVWLILEVTISYTLWVVVLTVVTAFLYFYIIFHLCLLSSELINRLSVFCDVYSCGVLFLKNV
jgi:hypothetical protein